MSTFSKTTTVARLEDNSHYFSRMLSLIPVEVYYPQQKHEEWSSTFMRNKKGVKSPKVKKEIKAAAGENQRAKYNPEEYKSLPDIMKEQVVLDGGLTTPAGDDEHVDGAAVTVESSGIGFSQPIRSREELKQRLRAKMNEMRGKRKAEVLGQVETDEMIAQRAYKKRKIDDRRAQKRKREVRKKQHKKVESTPRVPLPSREDRVKAVASGPRAVSGEVEYAKFDFTTDKPVPSYIRESELKKKVSKKQMLHRAVAKKEKLAALSGTAEGQDLVEKEAWKKMEQKARGEKVKDDVARIKKAIQRDERRKKKSGKEWKARIDTQKISQAKSQARRERNLKEVNDKRKEKRVGKRMKKRAGFEGKKRSFLNK